LLRVHGDIFPRATVNGDEAAMPKPVAGHDPCTAFYVNSEQQERIERTHEQNLGLLRVQAPAGGDAFRQAGAAAISIAEVADVLMKFVPIVGEVVALKEAAVGRDVLGLGKRRWPRCLSQSRFCTAARAGCKRSPRCRTDRAIFGARFTEPRSAIRARSQLHSRINEHLGNVFDEQELLPEATIRKFRIVQTEGIREVSRLVDHYNLDVVLAVGYRVRSHRGTQFRRWATERLTEYLTKGFVLDAAWETFYPDTEAKPLARILHQLGAWVLAVEYVHDLRRPAHDENLQRLKNLSAPLVKACCVYAVFSSPVL
jgi:hypothetical protein